MRLDPLFADGVIVVDKPVGPTSHDVVAVVKRAARVNKAGHTGTLDPLASGVLPIVLGKATRLAQFLAGAEKEYEAEIELGKSTTTFDRAGQTVEPSTTIRPVSELTRSDVEAAVAEFRGTYLQTPPLFSAKKVDGDRAYDLARQHEPVTLPPAEVSARALDTIEWSGVRLRLRLVCSAGFYVRSLAQAIGERLGTGAHLARLVRTRSGDFTLDSATSLGELDQRPGEVAGRVIPLHRLLPWLPALTLTAEGVSLASRGGFISAGHLQGPQSIPDGGKVRLMHPDGRLLAIADRGAGRGAGLPPLLHPGVVLE